LRSRITFAFAVASSLLAVMLVGCAVGKPEASEELAARFGELTSLEEQMTALGKRHPERIDLADLNALRDRYEQLKESVGSTDIRRYAKAEQRAWQALYNLVHVRIRTLESAAKAIGGSYGGVLELSLGQSKDIAATAELNSAMEELGVPD
jgi:hypothetical protein